MLNAEETAKWFIYHNPELASGYIDANTKVNKLLYFANLMYRCVHNENLINEDFIAFPNGPVVFSVYRDYRYNGLNRILSNVSIPDERQLKVLNIVNFVYGNTSTKELVEESHTHSLWKRVEKYIPNNPRIDFGDIEEDLIEYNKALYRTYADMDSSQLIKEQINGNIYYYYKNSFEMTDDIIERLSILEQCDEARFLEIIDGELVMS